MTESCDQEETPRSVQSIVEDWTDEQVLEYFMHMTSRVGLATDFIEDDDGNTVATVMIVRVGERMLASEPVYLDWPLCPAAIPEDVEVVKN